MRRKAAAILVFCGFFCVALLVVAEVALRMRHELILRRPICARDSLTELMTLEPGCKAWEDAPDGPYEFVVNEDGFRDRPRKDFAQGAVFLLGDSHAEGFRLPVEQGLSRRLEERLGTKVLNLGLQGTGPGQQALRAQKALTHYSPKGVIWLINPSDPIDEVFFVSIRMGEGNPFQDPSLRNHPLFFLNRLLQGKSKIVQKLSEIFLFQRPYRKFMANRRFEPRLHCDALVALAEKWKKLKVPLAFVAMGHGPKGAHLRYRGVEPDQKNYEELIDCARKTGAPIIDARREFEDPSLYWNGDWHFTPDGTITFADFLGPRLKRALSAKP